MQNPMVNIAKTTNKCNQMEVINSFIWGNIADLKTTEKFNDVGVTQN